jgi:TctA family transporter
MARLTSEARKSYTDPIHLMLMTQGDLWLILDRPIVLTLFAMSILSLFLPRLLRLWAKRDVEVEDEF